MHSLAVEQIVSVCLQRLAEGDCPTVEAPGRETLEDAVIELAAQRDRARRKLPALASALNKFAPDLAEELCRRWQAAGESQAQALTDFLATLSNGAANERRADGHSSSEGETT